MFASELMELARKNPKEYEGKKYKVASGIAVDGFGKCYKEFGINRDGCFSTDNLMIFTNSDTKLEEISQPVPFMEAVKVKCNKDGTRIICNHKGITKEYAGIAFTTINKSEPVTFDEILHGEWFIK